MKNTKNQKNKRRPGFTLVEIMVVVVIIGMLAGIVIPQVIGRLEESRRTTAKTQITAFAAALDMYNMHNAIYPTTQQGLQALVAKPAAAPVPKKYPPEPYLKEIPLDPWGNPYIYRCPGEKHAYDIISTARNAEEGGEGLDADVTNHDTN